MRKQSSTRRVKRNPGPFDPAVFLETVAARRAPKGRVIFAQGDAADAVFYIKQGKVTITVASRQGKDAVIALLKSGEFVGEGVLIGQPTRLATATAMTDCVVVRLEKAEFLRLLADEPAFSRAFMSYLLTRKTRIEEDSRSTPQLD